MKIKSLKLKTKNNPYIFVADTDDGVYLLHSDIIVKNGLSVGSINDELFFKSISESQELIAFNLVIKYISSKIKTEKQIKDYLFKKEFSADTIQKVLFKLHEYHIIDDKIYADTYIRSNTSFSKMKLKQKLYSQGVKKELVEAVTSELDDENSCLMNARKFLKNKELNKETLDKLVRRLYSQGYGWDSINKALRAMQLEYNEEGM